jgi:putative chitinase
MNNLTPSQIVACCPNAKDAQGLAVALNIMLPKYNIATADEVSGFLAQCGHESGDFNHMEENLNYRPESLMAVWPSRFPDMATALLYAHNPEKIANKVYANRMGNGSEASGDGWAYHGQGPIQLTGKDNFDKFAAACDINIQDVVDHIRTLEGAIESACWFWNTNKLSPLADEEMIAAMTRKINGGLIGEDDREARFTRCKTALA